MREQGKLAIGHREGSLLLDTETLGPHVLDEAGNRHEVHMRVLVRLVQEYVQIVLVIQERQHEKAVRPHNVSDERKEPV